MVNDLYDQRIMIETSQHIPRFDTLERIVQGLDLTVHGLLEEVDRDPHGCFWG